MGIKNFNNFIKDHFNFLNEKITITQLKNLTIAIDLSIYMWRFTCKAMKDSTLNENGNINRAEVRSLTISYFLKFMYLMIKNNIKFIFVADNIAPDEKNKTRVVRRENVSNNYIRIGKLQKSLLECSKISERKKVINNIKKLYISIGPTEEDWKIVVNFLSNIGTSLIKLNDKVEAEYICSELYRNRIVDAVVTDDSDVLLMKCDIIIKKIIFNKDLSYIVSITGISKPRLLRHLNLTSESLVDFGILCGLDFNTNIPNIGIVKAYSLICKYKSIDNIPLNEDIEVTNKFNNRKLKCRIKDISMLNHHVIRKLFSKTIDNFNKSELLCKFKSNIYEYYKETFNCKIDRRICDCIYSSTHNQNNSL